MTCRSSPATLLVDVILPGGPDPAFVWLLAACDEAGTLVGYIQPRADLDPATGQVTLHIPASSLLGPQLLLRVLVERPLRLRARRPNPPL